MAPQVPISPLSPARRTFYFRLSITIFVIAVPVLFLYATGYRFEGITGLVKTGGMYVSAERSGAEIHVNGELVRETGTFRRAFFVQDLEPGTYTVEVTKAGFHPWGKTLSVYAHIVTEAQAFNMPVEPLLTLIPPTLTAQSQVATSSVPAQNPVYVEIHSAFATTTATSTLGALPPRAPTSSSDEALAAAAATTTKEFRGMRLSDTGEHIVAAWTRSSESIPFYFCMPEAGCMDHIVLNTKGGKPSYFDFFPGSADLVLVTLPDGIWVTELDNRSGQNIQPLFLAEGSDFRVVDGNIYVETEDGELYEVEI